MASVLCRTFHDNAHEVAPPPCDVVVTFVDPSDRVRGEEEVGRVAKLCARNDGNVVSRRVTLLRVTLYDRS